MAKEELFKTRFTAWLFKQLGSIPIKRDSSDFRAIRNTLKYLKEGKPLVIFPEGTRGISEREKKAQPGIGLIAKKSKVPIIPVNIRGSDKALPNDAKWFKRHKIEVLIGPPLSVEYEIDNENISQVILDAIYALDFNNANITE